MELSHLNAPQQQAVRQVDGPVMILAGAGSGKTRTLVSRIQFLLEDKEISPFQVLAVTFSNKASREMRERLAQSTSLDVEALQVTTFHAFCAKVLRFEATYLGLSKSFTIYDDSESTSIVKGIFARRGISQKEMSPNELLYYIDDLHNQAYYPGCPERENSRVDQNDLLYHMYLEYCSELRRSNALDFGGLIVGVIELFEKHPKVLERYQQRYKYVLVDEYQDTNRAQFILINLLCSAHRNLCVVGDEDQSIYSWRGADIRNILDFEKAFPEAQIIKLEQNYRSSKTIIEAATQVIGNNIYRKGKEMWTSNPEGETIQVVECRDDRTEAEFICQEITSLALKGVPLQDVAIFYRNNSQSRSIEDALRKTKFPYRVVAGIKFYDRKEIKDMLAYLRCLVNGKDSLALSRVINVPNRGVGAVTLRKIEEEAMKWSVSLWEIMEKIVMSPEEFKHLRLSGKVSKAIQDLVYLIQECIGLEKQGEMPSHLLEKIMHESGYSASLRDEKSYESQARLENLDELTNSLKDYEANEENPSLSGFLENVTLDTDKQDDEFKGQQISLMTVHGSKGLEYPYVFVTGAEENLFPSFKSIEVGESAIEEERRLFYVAMTRAMQRLYITFAQGRMLWGSLKFNGPSRFINEIPDSYYKWVQYKSSPMPQKSHFGDDRGDFDDGWSYSSRSSDELNISRVDLQSKNILPKSKFKTGSKVGHQLYGKGTVLDSEGFGTEEKVTIMFAGGVKKKFMVKMAPLELL